MQNLIIEFFRTWNAIPIDNAVRPKSETYVLGRNRSGRKCVIYLVALLCGCSLQTKRPELQSKAVEDRPLVDPKYSMAADRSELEQLRKDIPAETKKRNDELALLMSLMGEIKRQPSEIREKFNSLMSKKREVFQKDITKRREEFQKKQTKDRDAFTKQMEATRKDFTDGKHTSQERNDFFTEIETKRRDFYADQREKRDEFEEQVREDRKNFEDYARERTNEFNEEHRAYTKRYDEFQKAKEKNKAVNVIEVQ